MKCKKLIKASTELTIERLRLIAAVAHKYFIY